MGWRKIKEKDIQIGTVVRMTKMIDDGSYGMATILLIQGDLVRLARPMAYATDYGSQQPLLTCEVFEVFVRTLLDPKSDFEVFKGRDDIRKLVVRP